MQQIMQEQFWGELREALLERLENLEYSEGGLRQYRTILNEIGKFLASKDLEAFSKDIGQNFTDHIEQHPIGKRSMRQIPTVLRHLHDLLDGNEYSCHRPFVGISVHDCFMPLLESYIKNLEFYKKRESTVKAYRHQVCLFLNYLHLSGVQNIAEIKAENMYDAFSKSGDKANFHHALKSFLRFVYKEGHISVDLSPYVPTVSRPHNIPSVYHKEEIEALLSCIDQAKRPGKRDYAIILLALRLGLRSGDIARLTFENINFDKKMIDLIQEKTEVPLQIALLPEVESALISYLRHERSDKSSPYIFLISMAPYTAITSSCVYGVIRKHFIKSGIESAGRKRGGHALRMTLASELISEDIPYDAVRKILGQEDPNATKRYIQFNIDELRRCALEVPPLTGTMANRFSYAKGGS